jgi:hypothetical protein
MMRLPQTDHLFALNASSILPKRIIRFSGTDDAFFICCLSEEES